MRNSNASKTMKINFNPDPSGSIEDKIKKISIKGGTKQNKSPETKNEKLEKDVEIKVWIEPVENIQKEKHGLFLIHNIWYCKLNLKYKCNNSVNYKI